MPLNTEADARLTLCGETQGAAPRMPYSVPLAVGQTAKCIASACSYWRWQDKPIIAARRGYCGHAGPPGPGELP